MSPCLNVELFAATEDNVRSVVSPATSLWEEALATLAVAATDAVPEGRERVGVGSRGRAGFSGQLTTREQGIAC